MPRTDWNERYETDDLPWDTGVADEHPTKLFESGHVAPGKTLELGCGTGPGDSSAGPTALGSLSTRSRTPRDKVTIHPMTNPINPRGLV